MALFGPRYWTVGLVLRISRCLGRIPSYQKKSTHVREEGNKAKDENQEAVATDKQITSSGEKKATASGSGEPAGCKDTIALKTEGNDSSIIATFSAATMPTVPCLKLFEL